MIRNLLRQRKKSDLRKRTSVYISNSLSHIIIAPQFITDSGIFYEQDASITIDLPIDDSTLGSEVIKSLNLFSKKAVNLRAKKPSDWPAFKHSKCKTILKFEEDYIFISIESANDSNLILVVEGYPFKDSDLSVKSTVSFYADKGQIGEKILKVYNACLTGKIS